MCGVILINILVLQLDSPNKNFRLHHSIYIYNDSFMQGDFILPTLSSGTKAFHALIKMQIKELGV